MHLWTKWAINFCHTLLGHEGPKEQQKCKQKLLIVYYCRGHIPLPLCLLGLALSVMEQTGFYHGLMNRNFFSGVNIVGEIHKKCIFIQVSKCMYYLTVTIQNKNYTVSVTIINKALRQCTYKMKNSIKRLQNLCTIRCLVYVQITGQNSPRQLCPKSVNTQPSCISLFHRIFNHFKLFQLVILSSIFLVL